MIGCSGIIQHAYSVCGSPVQRVVSKLHHSRIIPQRHHALGIHLSRILLPCPHLLQRRWVAIGLY